MALGFSGFSFEIGGGHKPHSNTTSPLVVLVDPRVIAAYTVLFLLLFKFTGRIYSRFRFMQFTGRKSKGSYFRFRFSVPLLSRSLVCSSVAFISRPNNGRNALTASLTTKQARQTCSTTMPPNTKRQTMVDGPDQG